MALDVGNHESSSPNSKYEQREPRIPITLQAVMISSQRGREVTRPPPNGVAFKSFVPPRRAASAPPPIRSHLKASAVERSPLKSKRSSPNNAKTRTFSALFRPNSSGAALSPNPVSSVSPISTEGLYTNKVKLDDFLALQSLEETSITSYTERNDDCATLVSTASAKKSLNGRKSRLLSFLQSGMSSSSTRKIKSRKSKKRNNKKSSSQEDADPAATIYSQVSPPPLYSSSSHPNSEELSKKKKTKKRRQRQDGQGSPNGPSAAGSKNEGRYHISPQAYWMATLRCRGYNATTYNAVDTPYYQGKPTPLQLASYGKYVQQLVETNNAAGLQKVLDAGLSPYACKNNDGYSILHMVCERGYKECLEVLLRHSTKSSGREKNATSQNISAGTGVNVVDSSGQTVLHVLCRNCRNLLPSRAALQKEEQTETEGNIRNKQNTQAEDGSSLVTSWINSSYFQMVDMILDQNKRLLCLADSDGKLPLSYVPRDPTCWTAWTRYLMVRKEKYWPERCLKKEGMEGPDPTVVQPIASSSSSTTAGSTSNISPSMSLYLALEIAEGNISPVETLVQQISDHVNVFESRTGSNKNDLDEECENNDDDDEDYDSEDDMSESTFDEDELEEILGCIGSSKPVAWVSKNSSGCPPKTVGNETGQESNYLAL